MLELRAPEFGNSFTFVPNTIHHRNLSGDLRVYQGSRPKWQGFSVRFTALTLAKIQEFETFVTSTRGQVVTFIDFELRRWTGIVTTPIIEIIKGRDNCDFSTTFEFEGSVEAVIE